MKPDSYGKQTKRWDTYFHDVCYAISTKSPCLSRKIGAILVKDHSVVATGYNGPPRGTPHCGAERNIKDEALARMISLEEVRNLYSKIELQNTCPRRILQYESGKGMQWCPAQHAEENAISNAARLGVTTKGCILYMNCVIPCQKCFGTLINAGIVEIVVDEITVYDEHTQFIMDNSNIKVREFKL